jgi:hypothetical protein
MCAFSFGAHFTVALTAAACYTLYHNNKLMAKRKAQIGIDIQNGANGRDVSMNSKQPWGHVCK